MEKKRNGDIELLRFVFAMLVVLYHFQISFSRHFFANGFIGVEFFFAVSGFLMAKSAKKICTNSADLSIPKVTYSFLGRKIKSFLPYLAVAHVLRIICYTLVNRLSFSEFVNSFFAGVPNYLMIHMSGMNYHGGFDMGHDWYLSALVLVTLILFPVLLYNYETSAKITFLAVGLITCGIRCMDSKGIVNGTILNDAMLRGIGEMALGAWGYEVSQRIGKINFTKLAVILLTCFKWCCYSVVFAYSCELISSDLQLVAYIFCLFGLILSFSDKTIGIANSPVIAFLGRISLPTYIVQMLWIAVVHNLIGDDIATWKVVMCACATPVVGFFYKIVVDFLFEQTKRLKPFFIREQNA